MLLGSFQQRSIVIERLLELGQTPGIEYRPVTNEFVLHELDEIVELLSTRPNRLIPNANIPRRGVSEAPSTVGTQLNHANRHPTRFLKRKRNPIRDHVWPSSLGFGSIDRVHNLAVDQDLESFEGPFSLSLELNNARAGFGPFQASPRGLLVQAGE